MVISTAGPISVLHVHRAHLQRVAVDISRLLLLGAFHTIQQHQDARSDQKHRPEPEKDVKRKEMKLIEQEDHAEPDKKKRTNWSVLSPCFHRGGRGLSEGFRLRGAMRIDGHINDECS